MRDVFELAARYLMPSIRRCLAMELIKKGLIEAEAAEILGLSRSSITRYMKSERGVEMNLSKFSDVMRLIEECANAIISNKISGYVVEEEMAKITAYVLSRKYFCTYHKKIYSEIDISECRVCPTIFTKLTYVKTGIQVPSG